jgi:CheY-like chemotaxis protein
MDEEIKILLVDDEADFTRPMSAWLNSEGYSVTIAEDGGAAINLIRENPPDIVFLDLKMPGMDGAEVLRNIRAFNKDIPIIIITAYVDDPKVQEMGEHGISGVFYKGDDFIEGLSLIKSVLRLKRK